MTPRSLSRSLNVRSYRTGFALQRTAMYATLAHVSVFLSFLCFCVLFFSIFFGTQHRVSLLDDLICCRLRARLWPVFPVCIALFNPFCFLWCVFFLWVILTCANSSAYITPGATRRVRHGSHLLPPPLPHRQAASCLTWSTSDNIDASSTLTREH